MIYEENSDKNRSLEQSRESFTAFLIYSFSSMQLQVAL